MKGLTVDLQQSGAPAALSDPYSLRWTAKANSAFISPPQSVGLSDAQHGWIAESENSSEGDNNDPCVTDDSFMRIQHIQYIWLWQMFFLKQTLRVHRSVSRSVHDFRLDWNIVNQRAGRSYIYSITRAVETFWGSFQRNILFSLSIVEIL